MRMSYVIIAVLVLGKLNRLLNYRSNNWNYKRLWVNIMVERHVALWMLKMRLFLSTRFAARIGMCIGFF
jgi:hypothetical protein